MAMPDLLSATKILFFSLYGINVKVEGSNSSHCLAELTRDFHFFINASSYSLPISSNKNYTIKLSLQNTTDLYNILPDKAAKEIHSEYVVYEDKNKSGEKIRWIDYHGKALLKTKEKKYSSEAILWCNDPSLTHELAYLYLLSRIGVFLDKKGLHRIHALGFQNKKSGALVLIPSGGGKSSLALELLQNKDISLLSDDSPLIDRKGRLYPFPLRLAFTSHASMPDNLEQKTGRMERRKYGVKKLLSIKDLPNPPASNASEPKFLFLAERHGSKKIPRLRRLHKYEAIHALLRDMVVGLGLPQLAELVLTKGIWSLPSLIPTASSRTLAAANLVQKCQCYALELSHNSQANAELIRKKFEESRT